LILENSRINGIKLIPFNEILQDRLLQEAYLKWVNDFEIIRLINSLELMSPKRDDFLKNTVDRFTSKHCQGYFIFVKADNCYAGTIKLDRIDFYNSSAEIGIMIGEKKYWGKGIGYNASLLLIDYALNLLCLRRVWGGTVSINTGMQKIFQKLGFKKEGKLRQAINIGGTYYDSIMYGLLREEFSCNSVFLNR
jgi:[ribosomal protein S5]-alanine N-acetyltransferase